MSELLEVDKTTASYEKILALGFGIKEAEFRQTTCYDSNGNSFPCSSFAVTFTCPCGREGTEYIHIDSSEFGQCDTFEESKKFWLRHSIDILAEGTLTAEHLKKDGFSDEEIAQAGLQWPI